MDEVLTVQENGKLTAAKVVNVSSHNMQDTFHT